MTEGRTPDGRFRKGAPGGNRGRLLEDIHSRECQCKPCRLKRRDLPKELHPAFGKRWKVRDSSRMGGARKGGGTKKGSKRAPYAPRKNPLSLEMRAKMSAARIGCKGPGWKGGRTELSKLIRSNSRYNEWRRKVFLRDSFTCVICGISGCWVEADHYPVPFSDILTSGKITTVPEAIACEQLWNHTNGRTLCRPCHHKTDNHGIKKSSKCLSSAT